MEEVDRIVAEETLVYHTTPLSPTQTSVSPPYNKPLIDLKVIEHAYQ
jgi:hypothetical protein